MRSFVAAIAILVCSCAATAQSFADDPQPLSSRTWNCLYAGGLADGACLGVTDDDQARIQRPDGSVSLIPIELFHVDEQRSIRSHFGKEAPGDREKSEPERNGHPWHSSRGGVIVLGKIVGRDGNMLFVVDDQGSRLRIPYELLAVGAQEHARKHVTELEGREFVPATPEPAAPAVAQANGGNRSPRANRPTRPVRPTRPRPADETSEPEAPAMEPETPANPNPVNPTPTPLPPTAQPSVPQGQSIPNPNERPEPRGESRRWQLKTGLVFAEGRFVQISGPAVIVQSDDGNLRHLPLELLSDVDRRYAETLDRGGEVGTVPEDAIAVNGDRSRFIMLNHASATTLLVEGSRVHLLDQAGEAVVASRDLEVVIEGAAGGEAGLVVGVANRLFVLDSSTLEVRKEIELWRYRKINSLAVHPTRPFAFVSIEGSREAVQRNPAAAQQVVRVDLRSGDVSEVEDVYAKFLAIDPAGRYLFAGYAETYQSGTDIHINPDLNIIETPEYGNVDFLFRYRINGTRLVKDDELPDAGANGQGVVLSPDGSKVSYLGFAGYPTFSGNVAALDSTNFERRPVSFPMKDRSDCKRIAYHPTLPILVSPGEEGVVFYSTSSGEPIEESLIESEELEGAAIESLGFSADGTRLLVVVSQNGSGKFVMNVRLNLESQK